MVRRAPEPALPRIRVVHDGGVADGVGEPHHRRQVVADIAPGVVRAVAERDGALAMLRAHPLDLGRDDVQRLVPRDALVARDAAHVLVARAVRVEIDALHRVEQPVGRIDQRLPGQRMARHQPLARRGEVAAARMDGPGRGVGVVELDGSRAYDLAVLDVDEDRPAIRAVGEARHAAAHVGAEFPADAPRAHDGLGEPVAQLVGPLERQVEVLLRVDLALIVDRRGQQPGGELRVLEAQHHVGLGVKPASGADAAVLEAVPAADLAVPGAELGGEILLPQPGAEIGVAPRRPPQHPEKPEKDDRKSHGRLAFIVGRAVPARQPDGRTGGFGPQPRRAAAVARPAPPLRGASRRSNPVFPAILDCFAALAMTGRLFRWQAR